MADPPAAASMLGIETVEWFAEGGENLTVRVIGRWRRRRPAWSAQPVLVVEAAGRRFRFPAMPEPPSLTGTGPGTWRITFAVPAALAPELAGRACLAFGAVVVPLPVAVQPPGHGAAAPTTAAPEGRRAPPTPTGCARRLGIWPPQKSGSASSSASFKLLAGAWMKPNRSRRWPHRSASAPLTLAFTMTACVASTS